MSDEDSKSMADFSALIDAQLKSFHGGFDPGEKVSGVVAEVGPEFVVVDLNAKREGVIARAELEDEDGALSVAVGDALTAVFVAMHDGAFLLSMSLSGAAGRQGLRACAEQGMPVEGVVTGEINGGFEVTVDGQRAFCPYSQMDVRHREASEYVGGKLQFMVAEFDREEGNIVLSRRDLLERERRDDREALRQTLKEGDLRDGVVTRVADFGAFVDLGGIDGLVPLHELTFDRKAQPGDIVREGERVTVLVQRIDWEEEKISLSLRYAQGDPWDAVEMRYPVGSSVRVTVTRLAAFGAFAELDPGVEGLVHISRLGNGRRLQHAREVLAEGQELDVEVESVDAGQRRIGLRPVDTRLRQLTAANRVEPGAILTGIVDGHRDFGVFVRINEQRTGLLHISETQVGGGGNAAGKLQRAFPAGSEIDVVVKSLDGQRVSLALPQAGHEDRLDRSVGDEGAGAKRGSAAVRLGSLGDLLDGLKLGGHDSGGDTPSA